ncbi:MAG: phage tail terminator protein [Eubacteriales bacterium]
MSVIESVLAEVIRLAGTINPAPYAVIKTGALPADNGLCMSLTPAAAITRHMDMGAEYGITAVLNGKNVDQFLLSDTLNRIHEKLTQTKVFSTVTGAQITSVETVSMPNPIGREDGGQWLYGSSIRIKFYYRKV